MYKYFAITRWNIHVHVTGAQRPNRTDTHADMLNVSHKTKC